MKRLLAALVLAGVVTYAWRLVVGGRADTSEGWDLPPAEMDGAETQQIDDEFLAILACPADRQGVRREGDALVCSACGRRYPIRDGVPVMLLDG